MKYHTHTWKHSLLFFKTQKENQLGKVDNTIYSSFFKTITSKFKKKAENTSLKLKTPIGLFFVFNNPFFSSGCSEHGHESGSPHAQRTGHPGGEYVSWLGKDRHGHWPSRTDTLGEHFRHVKDLASTERITPWNLSGPKRKNHSLLKDGFPSGENFRQSTQRRTTAAFDTYYTICFPHINVSFIDRKNTLK